MFNCHDSRRNRATVNLFGLFDQEGRHMRVIVAARLSQEAGQTGIDTQDIETRRWAEREGHAVVAVIADRKSGTVPPWKRPNLREWVTQPEKLAQYDAVAGLTFDRLSRGDDKSTDEIKAWAREHGKQLLTADGLRFPCEGEDGIRWDLAARLAHAEWLRASERYRRMQKYLIDNGWLCGSASYGYQIVGVNCGESPCLCKNDRKALEVNPVTGRVAMDMVAWYLAGDSWTGIARRLNDKKIPSPQGHAWDPWTVGRTLKRETLIGVRKNKAGKVILRFDPILANEDGTPDMVTWNKLQAMMGVNAKRRGPSSKNPGLLSGILFCEKCEGPMYYRLHTQKRKNGSKYVKPYYRCHGNNVSPSRCRNMISADDMHEALEAELIDLDRWNVASEQVWEVTTVKGRDHQEEIDAIDARIDLLDRSNAAAYLAAAQELLADREALEGMEPEPEKVTEQPAGIAVGGLWARLNEEQKRAYLVATGISLFAWQDKTPTFKGMALRMRGNPARVSAALTSILPGLDLEALRASRAKAG